MLIDELRTRLSAFNDVFNHNMLTVQQRDYMWFKCRLGVITASSISGVLAKTGSAARDGIMAELIAEIATGAPAEPVSAKALQHGLDNEPFAIDSYSFATGEIVNQIPFVYRDETMRCGCSPSISMMNCGMASSNFFMNTSERSTVTMWSVCFNIRGS